MSRVLNSKPNITQLKNQAKDILDSHKQGRTDICKVLKNLNRFKGMPDKKIIAEKLALNEAQYALAMDYGFSSWNAMIKHVQALKSERHISGIRKANGKVYIDGLPRLSWDKSGVTTFAAALASALSATPHPFTYDQIMGYSGLAFRLRWYRRTDISEWCFSSPTGEFPEEMKATQANTGWHLDINDTIDLSETQLKDLHDKIIYSIDNGTPIIGHPNDLDVAVLYGYEQKENRLFYLWHSYNSRKTLKLPREELKRMIIIPDKYKAPKDIQACIINALSLKSWRQKSWIPQNYQEKREHSYLFGQKAFETWIDDLDMADSFSSIQKELLFNVSRWCFISLIDARNQASIFLDSHADLFDPKVARLLKRAANIYAKQAKSMADCANRRSLFGRGGNKTIETWDKALRKNEMAILDKSSQFDTEAIALIDKALNEYYKMTDNMQ